MPGAVFNKWFNPKRQVLFYPHFPGEQPKAIYNHQTMGPIAAWQVSSSTPTRRCSGCGCPGSIQCSGFWVSCSSQISFPGIRAGWARCKPSKQRGAKAPSHPSHFPQWAEGTLLSLTKTKQVAVCTSWQQCRMARRWKWVRPWEIASQTWPPKVKPKQCFRP